MDNIELVRQLFETISGKSLFISEFLEKQIVFKLFSKDFGVKPKSVTWANPVINKYKKKTTGFV